MRQAAIAIAAISVVTVTLAAGQTAAPEGVRNYTRVDATTGCAGATTPAAMRGLHADGFRAVINLRLETEEGADIDASRAAAETAGLHYVHIPFDSRNPRPEVVDQFLAAVQDPANSPVLVHCATANRVGMMWLIKRVMVDGWTTARASEEAARIGLKSPQLEAFALEYLKSHGKG